MVTNMQYGEIKELSDEICEMYKTLQDNDADTAFYLMKESSLLLPSFEELSHEITKKAMNLERFAKASHAKISRDSSTKVTEGDRIATSHEVVQGAWKEHAQALYTQRLIQTQIDLLKRVYFDCKMIYENVCRQNRSVVHEKMVGHT